MHGGRARNNRTILRRCLLCHLEMQQDLAIKDPVLAEEWEEGEGWEAAVPGPDRVEIVSAPVVGLG